MHVGHTREGFSRYAHHEHYIGDGRNFLVGRKLPGDYFCLMAGHMPARFHHLFAQHTHSKRSAALSGSVYLVQAMNLEPPSWQPASEKPAVAFYIHAGETSPTYVHSSIQSMPGVSLSAPP